MTAETYSLVLIGAQLIALAWIVQHDLRTLVVPNRYVYPAIGLSLLAIAPLGIAPLTNVWLGAFAAFGIMLAIALVSRGAMGFGDTKVSAFCGAIVGLQGVVPMLMFTVVGGGIISAGLVVTRMSRRSDAVAYTPFLLAGVVGTLWLRGLTA